MQDMVAEITGAPEVDAFVDCVGFEAHVLRP